jgi:ComF family protein
MDEPLAEKPEPFQRLQRFAGDVWQRFVDAVTPPRCLTCRNRVASDAGLCITCWSTLKTISEPVCDALGTPFEYDEGEGALSAAAIANPPVWDKARAAVVYNGNGRLIVHALKYQDRHEAALVMARMMMGAGRRMVTECDIVLPVPLHRYRLWQRRFNQSALLAQHLARLAEKPFSVDALLRTKPTRQQVGLDAEERRRNVSRAFAVDAEKLADISGKSVLLVDDVRTTGATVAACAKTLKDAGATQVHVLTFALVLEPYRPHIVA